MDPPVPLTEFYLATLWTYKPKTVTQVIDDMDDKGFDQAEFVYDREYSWFRVTCRKDQADEIRTQFCLTAREIEDEAFDDCEDDLLSLDGTLQSSFDNEWFSQDTTSSNIGEVGESYCRPRALAEYPYVELWDDLDKGKQPYTYWEIVSRYQAALMENTLGIKLSAALVGKLVYVAGHRKESVDEAMERLRIMLTTRKLLPRVDHIVYAEDSLSPVAPGLTADIRYLANIDPRLASSTLIDRLVVDMLVKSYETLYREASSIRICPWDSGKGCYVSLLGPKVATRPRDKTALGNRPAIFTRIIDKYTPPKKPDGHSESQGGGVSCQVGTWVEAVPIPEESVRRAAHYVLDTGPQAVIDSSEMPGQGDLMDFHDDETTLCTESPTVATPGTATGKPGLTGADPEMSPSYQTSSTRRAQLGTSSAKETVRPQGHDLGFTGDDSLIDMLAAVDTRSAEDAPRLRIDWGMAPLIPLPVDNSALNRNLTSTPQVGRGDPQAESDPEKEATIEKHGSARQSGAGKSPHPHGLTTPDVRPPKTGGSGYPPVTEDFVSEIHAAMVNLLSMGPYRRGKVEVRAEIGRIVLEKVDKTGLAFNNESTPSQGWEKAMLLERLKTDFGGHQNIHFTKILSAYAPNIEDMINTEKDGVRLWEHKPSCASTTYSFYCGLRSDKHIFPFFVDIEDDGTLSTELSYSVRVHSSRRDWDTPMPIYVHAICRHWDLRIVTCHVKTDELETACGFFARDLMQSLSILRNENGALELQFAVPSTSPADVREVRVLTKWRYSSVDQKSTLEITEVQQMKTEPYSEGPYSKASWNSYEGRRARPWSQRMTKDSKGEVARWYEAAVLSVELEDICRQNALLRVGTKADWDAEDLGARGVFSAVYGPALQMVRAMDHVGRLDDNNLSQSHGNLLLQHNDPPTRVVGVTASKKGKNKV
ncbi:uncharacterized protein B0H64DRAFT_448155 [Chaetomium fimeti]|uniref:Uncharacterized protein n=1 Tax=Chaetomium fimeti TaxID=1854472 RepID=A0AAE0HP23_9PEZI|nr:hypothetical protein B0H64DRAFT_448155 [Chaetomium fimeti]